jgi:putative FmdB family regulatory protein
MPTYEYECQTCQQRTEAVQKFSDPALTTCESCGGPLRKVFSAVGIVFKGSGFYKNDSRSTNSSATPPSSTPSAAPAATPATPAPSSPAPTASTGSSD